MFQDIAPHKIDITYAPVKPRPEDLILIFQNQRVVYSQEGGTLSLPTRSLLKSLWGMDGHGLIYLFSVDETAIYLHLGKVEDRGEFQTHSIMGFRRLAPEWLAFAAVTAAHLAHWYELNMYCGKCGTDMSEKSGERALKCPICGQVVYPRISPVIIVGVTDGDRLLLTRYSETHSAYHRYALIAGFVEIGETLEDTVRREVMEEVGLSVKNIRYWKSQPWGFSDSLLMGFFADLDGSPELKIDREELSEGVWFSRGDLPTDDSTLSLTWTMIEYFRSGENF